MPKTIEQRILAKRRVDPGTGCWEWQGRPCGGGYRLIMVSRRRYRVHRLAASLWLGFDLDSPLLVCHKCDNRACFNPDHLFIGTYADNRADMDQKGRAATCRHDPEKFGKLNVGDVERIRNALEAKRTLRDIGQEFGVSHEAVRMIRDGRTWKVSSH